MNAKLSIVRSWLKPYARELVLLGVLIAVCVTVGALSPHFWNVRNLLDMTRYKIDVGLVALMMTLVISTGGIDLSVGSNLAMSGVVLGFAWQFGVPLPLAILLGLATSALGGLFNGLATVWAKIPPLIVTLATLALFRGMAMAISKGQPVSDFPDWFQQIGGGYVGLVPVQLIFFLFMALLVAVVARATPVGLYAEAVGVNPIAARFAAVPGPRLLVGLYTATGLMSGCAGVIWVSLANTAKANAGTGLELEAIAAVVLGGTRITGGAGSLSGTVLGLLILAVLRHGLQLAGIATVWSTIVTGVLLILTAALNEWLAVLTQHLQRRALARPTH